MKKNRTFFSHWYVFCLKKKQQVSSAQDVNGNVENEGGLYSEEAEKLRKSKERWQLRKKNNEGRTTLKTMIDQEDHHLESSLKKCTAFVRKLKSISKDTKETLLSEIETLNLSMYISEVSSAICEAKFRVSNVPTVVEVCSAIYRRYPEFVDLFVDYFSRVLSQPNSIDWNARRSLFHLLVELCCVNIISSSKLVSFLREACKLISVSSDPVTALSMFTSLARTYQIELLTIPQNDQEKIREQRAMDDDNDDSYQVDWEYFILPSEEKKLIFTIYKFCYEKSCALLNDWHKELVDWEKETNTVRQTQVELLQDTQGAQETKRKLYDKLCNNIKTLCSLFDFELPFVLLEERDGKGNANTSNQMSMTENEIEMPMRSSFETEDERKFYEDLPCFEMNAEKDAKESSLEIQSNTNVESSNNPSKNTQKHPSLDHLLSSLASYAEAEQVDHWLMEHLTVFKKSSLRKRLVKGLLSLSFRKPELIPLLSRVTAALNPLYSDIAANLVQTLKDDFNNYFERKESSEYYLQCRLWNARFIGELTKFRMFPMHIVIHFMKMCLDDFVHYNIDVVCALIESCGRFLYSHSETQQRMGNLLDILWRLRSVKNLQLRHEVMVENAYFTVKAVNSNNEKTSEREPVKEFIRFLLFGGCYRSRGLPWMVNKLRKLPCNMDIESYLVKKFLKAEKFPFDCLGDIAKVITEYSKYRDSIGIGVVDGIIEAVLSSLENADNRCSQQRIAQLKLLGELFQTRLISERLIFNVLYLLIAYGMNEHSSNSSSEEDDWVVRIRMVVTLLETCGMELMDAISFGKLETFFIHLFETIVYLSRQSDVDTYVKVLSLLPIHLQHLITELLDFYSLRYMSSLTVEMLQTKLAVVVDKMVCVPDLSLRSLEKSYSLFGSKMVRANVAEGSISNEETNTCQSSLQKASWKELENEEEGSEDILSPSVLSFKDETMEGSTSETRDMSYEEENFLGEDSDSFDEETSQSDRWSQFAEKQQELDSFDQEMYSMLTESLSEANQNRYMVGSSSFSSRPLLASSAIRSQGSNSLTCLKEQRGNSVCKDIPYQVLLKRGGKSQVRLLHIPSDSSLVTASKATDEVERAEKEELKRLVLKSNTVQKKNRYRKR
eukprot:jgi/Galph1/3815/GphlegSOOS_G2482.1